MAGRLSGSDSPVSAEDVTVEAPRAILRLPEHVVNKIAAGEIIHRPANAIKEMMENSIDAGASMIRVQLKDGGLKMLQIQDDGSGVAPSDMPLLCERFATSKLKDFSDLSRMTTFGFRGEALASISYVSASMTVLSKTHSSEVAYKAYYASGQLAPAKPGQSTTPKPCAGSQGTTITVEDLFYNVPQRKRALKSASEEYALSLEIMSKYAVHYGGRGIGFTCKKVSANVVDLSIPSSLQTSTIDAISLVYGNAVAKELQHLSTQNIPKYGCSVEGWLSGPNWSAKKSQFLCFINNRLVDCVALKRSLLALYSTLLPRGGHPWIYLSLDISPEKVDVNVHPTKKEVRFLDEEEIVEIICDYIQDLLASSNTSRNFQMTQAVLGNNFIRPTTDDQPVKSPSMATPASSRSGYPQHMVRVDAKSRTLDAMSGFQTQASSIASLDSRSKIRGEDQGWTVVPDTLSPNGTESMTSLIGKTEDSKTNLQSIYELREEVKRKRHHGMTKILEDYTLVGVVDTSKGLALIQHGTKLYLLQYAAILEEAAYQSLLRQFGALTPFQISLPLQIDELVNAALILEQDSATQRQALNLTDDVIMKKVNNRLVNHADMLEEYFSIIINQSTRSITALPTILTSQMLFNIERLPTLVLRLATQVDWTSEKECFQGIMREIAIAHVPSTSLSIREREEELKNKGLLEKEWKAGWSHLIRSMIPNSHLSQHTITEVASLPSLYSVFERC